MAVSTPTAVTRILNSSWEQATALVRLAEREIFGAYREALLRAWRDLELSSQKTRDGFLRILGQLRIMEQSVRNGMARIGYEVEKKARQMQEWSTALPKYFSFALLNTREYLLQSEKAILAYNPKRQLKLGYSIARMKGKIIRSVSDVRVHDLLDLTVTDGIIGAKVLLRNKATEDK
jgi:exonuclease VII large subunit